ncbi:MAG: YaiI/YqxD family protein [Gammaproteobacteria bacterium]|nr:YaiI/YqxD family protein [Gammaproteobacteria bacterium]
MQIWVDADACPKSIKEILFRAANRTKTMTILVSNQLLTIPPSPFIKKIRVSAGLDVADKWIVDAMEAGDLVITADIPLADAAVTKGGSVLNPRGEMYSEENIKHRLAIRDLMTDLRDNGLIRGGPGTLSTKEITVFANQLDRLLAKTQVRGGSIG